MSQSLAVEEAKLGTVRKITPVKREIVINGSTLEVRVGLLEDGVLSEFHLERNERQGLVGNIYKGKVTRVLPGMQAAFVDIGLEKAGFLHVSDFHTGVEGFGSAAEVIGEEDVETEPLHDHENGSESLQDVTDIVDLAEIDDIEDNGDLAGGAEDEPSEGDENAAPSAQARGGRGRRRRQRPERRVRLPIEQVLKRGQDIIVQVAKEPMGTKGARLTSFISLPGRHLVYTPTSNHIGISRRIESAQERQRLRAAVGELRPDQGGFIVRTVCEGVSKREIQRDVSFLTKLWSGVVKLSETTPPASLLSVKN